MRSTHTRTGEEKFWITLLWVGAVGVLVFLMAPILAIIPLSFNGGQFLTYPLQGFSLRWYAAFLTDPVWIRALRNSLIIGIVSTILATGLGTLASLGLVRAKFRGKGLVMAVLLSPMIVPVVITAVGFYLFFAPLGLTANYPGLILAHTVLAAPFVVISVTATLQGFDMNLARAAASLGADQVTTFRRVILPLIAPGVASGALFAFATSFDEVVVVLLVAGPEQRTLPREMFSGIRENISPTITAVATVLILFSTLLLIALEALRRRNERMRGLAG
ncbi:ABC transporter permease [Rhodospirillum rubrum]|uniref:Binding-protein-dependent transport systems inner membrane component n=1 Tax=Rhodospirillum rubrum (strain ATCC 11170 / ATH 1.1.1 / DSM 467 / LMG 4362 / NCIMB 8255 / S1) TaxID=269796 RepID=Q2RSQ0_RHORT|nr:ABC transporter permease [Rhodospirillum rubrum]ABC22845.1 Binding-protein-dependent transport systems inner membrane component [Rhodospirillum rubrum ATCC 11170]AEO48569.1 binding-protein dependent transport system inner membrane protein [Rhodospirillum rubrum F11]MBK5954452.1 polyamine ABC transporter permease [Rhodospirillum rubrum]QXG78834.1 ABC transporter permease [Rhodospirillum rubrum]HAP99731.1 ABC transporter permease [Rhodospirillum rubrum]